MDLANEKPITRLACFANTLGWRDLRVYQHTIDDSTISPQPFITTWYESGISEGGRNDLFLQINEIVMERIVDLVRACN